MDNKQTAILTASFLAMSQLTFVNYTGENIYSAQVDANLASYKELYSYNDCINTNLSGVGENLLKVYKKLEHLSTLKDNWDGRGALPISDKVLNNIKSILELSNDADWTNWLIGPDVNATIRMQSKKNKASISIGANEYSYYARLNGQRLGESHITFLPDVFLSLMRELSA